MTDVDTDGMDEGEISPPKSKAPMMMMVIGLAGLAGGAYLGLRGSPEEPAPADETADAAAIGPLIDLDSFVVNLNERAEMRYLKCKIAIEAETDAAAAQVEADTIRIRNSVLLYLSNLTLADTAGIEKKEAIQSALTERVGEVVGGTAVRGIYLTEFVVQ